MSSQRVEGAPIDIHPEVEHALAKGLPVVSLETALVTNGLPQPASLEVPLDLEAAVRSTGATPATIGLIGGRVKIGMERHELVRLAEGTHSPVKVSRRDIAAAVATNQDGGTTCSATLVFSALAGIKVFATGGLGGVHRGGEQSLDVSADLLELTRCPVGLVSSGVKSILDIGRTLEYLETAGVPVIAYSQTKDFPAFFSRKSGKKVPWNVSDPLLAARMLATQANLKMQNGILFAAPIPDEYEVAGAEIQRMVDQAVRESEENAVARSGKDATPWLLARVLELSGGKSLQSNIALLKNNAVIGGQIAMAYSHLARQGVGLAGGVVTPSTGTLPFSTDVSRSINRDIHPHKGPAEVVIVGCSALDVTAKGDSSVNRSLASHSTVPGSVSLTLGGVARNIAEATHRSSTTAYPGLSSLLISPIGEDMFGHLMAEEITRRGMRNDGLVVLPKRTAVCNMVLDGEGGLVGGVADMDVTDQLGSEMIVPRITAHAPRMVAFDGNLSVEAIGKLVDHCHKSKLTMLFEPTSIFKSRRIMSSIKTWLKHSTPEKPLIAHFTPNVLELVEVYEQAKSEEYDLMSHPWWWDSINNLSLGSNFRLDVDQLARRSSHSDDSVPKGNLSFLTTQGIAQMAVHLLPFFQHIWIKCGSNGAIAVMRISAQDAKNSGFANERTNVAKRTVVAHGINGEILVLRHFPAFPVESLINVTGAGDSFVGALIAGIASDPRQCYQPEALEGIVNMAQHAAGLTLQSHDAVSPLISELIKHQN